MALDKSSMAGKMQTALLGIVAVQVDGTMTQMQKDAQQLQYLEALAEGIILEITTNAVVVGTSVT